MLEPVVLYIVVGVMVISAASILFGIKIVSSDYTELFVVGLLTLFWPLLALVSIVPIIGYCASSVSFFAAKLCRFFKKEKEQL